MKYRLIEQYGTPITPRQRTILARVLRRELGAHLDKLDDPDAALHIYSAPPPKSQLHQIAVVIYDASPALQACYPGVVWLPTAFDTAMVTKILAPLLFRAHDLHQARRRKRISK